MGDRTVPKQRWHQKSSGCSYVASTQPHRNFKPGSVNTATMHSFNFFIFGNDFRDVTTMKPLLKPISNYNLQGHGMFEKNMAVQKITVKYDEVFSMWYKYVSCGQTRGVSTAVWAANFSKPTSRPYTDSMQTTNAPTVYQQSSPLLFWASPRAVPWRICRTADVFWFAGSTRQGNLFLQI